MSPRIFAFALAAFSVQHLTGDAQNRMPHAEYSAVQTDKQVTVFAKGMNNSGGWKNELTQLPLEIFPPMFKFTQTPPNGAAIQVITPFAVQASFNAGSPVESVTVIDAAGMHKIAVKKGP